MSDDSRNSTSSAHTRIICSQVTVKNSSSITTPSFQWSTCQHTNSTMCHMPEDRHKLSWVSTLCVSRGDAHLVRKWLQTVVSRSDNNCIFYVTHQREDFTFGELTIWQLDKSSWAVIFSSIFQVHWLVTTMFFSLHSTGTTLYWNNWWYQLT